MNNVLQQPGFTISDQQRQEAEVQEKMASL